MTTPADNPPDPATHGRLPILDYSTVEAAGRRTGVSDVFLGLLGGIMAVIFFLVTVVGGQYVLDSLLAPGANLGDAVGPALAVAFGGFSTYVLATITWCYLRPRRD